MEDPKKSEGARVDGRGIVPPSVHEIVERPAPDGVVLFAVSGEVDVAAAPELRERFGEARARRPRGIVVDLSEVTFADSSALRELLRADSDLRADGARFITAALPPAVDRLLELTRVRELLDIAPSVESALRQLGVPR